MMWTLNLTCIKRLRVCVQFVPPPGVHLHNIFPFFLFAGSPDYVAIDGNENADKTAKSALNLHITAYHYHILQLCRFWYHSPEFYTASSLKHLFHRSNIHPKWFLLCTPLALKNFNLSLAWYSRYLLAQNAVKPWQTKPQLWELQVSSDWKCAACTFELRSDAF